MGMMDLLRYAQVVTGLSAAIGDLESEAAGASQNLASAQQGAEAAGSAYLSLLQLMTAAGVAPASGGRQPLGTEAEQLARREGRAASMESASDVPLTLEERRRMAEELQEEQEKEVEETVALVRSFRAGASKEFVRMTREAADDLGYVIDDSVGALGSAADDGVYVLDTAGDAFGAVVDDAVGMLADGTNQAAQALNELLRSAGGGEFVSEAFEQVEGAKGGSFSGDKAYGADRGFSGGSQVGGAVSNSYALQLIEDYNLLVRANERYARGEGSLASQQNYAANRMGMSQLEDLFRRLFGRFGNLEDLAREQLKRTTKTKKKPPSRTRSTFNPATSNTRKRNTSYLP